MEPAMIVCPVCKIAQCDRSAAKRDIYRISCMRCGDFSITGTEEHILSQDNTLSPRQRLIASSIIYDFCGTSPLIDEYNLKDYFEKNDISILEKADKLLLWLEQQSSSENGFQQYASIDFEDLSLQAECWAMNTEEIETIFNILKERELLAENPTQTLGSHVSATITAKGWERLEQLRTPNKDSVQGFVAMWFAPEMANIYENVLAPAIQSAGYTPHRVDM